MKMNSKTLFSLLSTFMKREITNFQVSLPMQYHGCQRFSCAVSGVGHFCIVPRAKNLRARLFGSRLTLT